MHREWTDLLSGYLDGELDPGRRAALETHLAACPHCTRVAADLASIVSAAPSYSGRPPTRDLWPAIAREIDRKRTVAWPEPRRWLIAAGLAVAAAGLGGVWYWRRPATERPPDVAVREAPALARPAAISSPGYDSAVADLEQTLAANRARLDTSTVRIVEESLRTIDQAIVEARAAIQRDTANGYLNHPIAANMRKKLNLLRLATRTIGSET